ncbi:MAG: ATP-dependent protease, partial [Verrucomicrobiae bacterium]|nr:ATP-dependent protease [Verrucomicrobiae bacterium]
FIVSGAFDSLVDIVRRRLRTRQIGFGTPPDADAPAAAWLRQARTEDFIQFGFEPEFIGRLPVRVVLDPLSVEDLEEILRRSEGSVLRQYEASFQALGIDVVFTEDGMRAIAEQAARENTGARGLLTVCERVLRDFKFELPSSPVRQLVVDRAVVEHPAEQLQRILKAAAT